MWLGMLQASELSLSIVRTVMLPTSVRVCGVWKNVKPVLVIKDKRNRFHLGGWRHAVSHLQEISRNGLQTMQARLLWPRMSEEGLA